MLVASRDEEVFPGSKTLGMGDQGADRPRSVSQSAPSVAAGHRVEDAKAVYRESERPVNTIHKGHALT